MPSPFRSLTSALALVAASAALAGPLNPPAGPITATQKPLADLEPRTAVSAANTPGDTDSLFRISQPGSYYLAANIDGVSGKHGIEIAAGGVTLDLNGFDLVGVPGSLHGVTATLAAATHIEVRNGSIRTWGASGINFNSAVISNAIVRGVRSSSNGQLGIALPAACVITDCFVTGNPSGGIIAGEECLIVNCIARANGLDGIDAGGQSTVVGCIASHNSLDGFELDPGCTISQCTAADNGVHGFSVGAGASISACAATGNLNAGISASGGCTVANNACRLNGIDGIAASSACLILANTCATNGQDLATGAGIHVTGGDNRIDGNHCAGQDRGIDVDAAGNFIVRNTCANNTTNWDLAANNVFGPIVNRSAPASAAVTGDAAASSLGSTDPNANYTY